MTIPHRLKAMVVDDDPMIRLLIIQTLEATGADVVGTASSAEEGLRLAKSVDTDIALLDVRLGDDSSFNIAEELERRGIPFIYVTGYPNRVDLDGQFTAIAVEKPFSDDDLERAIERCLAKRADRDVHGARSIRSFFDRLRFGDR